MEARVDRKLKAAKTRKGTRHWDYGTDYDPGIEKKAIDPKKVMDVEAEADEFVAAVAPTLENIYSEFGDGVTSTFGLEWNLQDPEVAKDLLQRSNRLRGVVDTTWHAVQDAIVDGEAAGENIDGISKRIGHVFTQAKGYRSRMIARTETIGAANAGAFRGANQTGVVENKVWLAAVDHRTRSSHVTADGQAVALKAKFNVGASKMDHPGDPEGGAGEVVNCRCTMMFERGKDAEANVPDLVGVDGGDATPIKPAAGTAPGASGVGVVRKGAKPKYVRQADGTRTLANEVAAKGKVPDGVNAARKAIDGIHGAPDGLPEIDVYTASGERSLGGYHFRHSGEAVQFHISTHGTEQGVNFAHEYGHFFDHQDFGKAGAWTSETAANAKAADRGPLAAWWDAVEQTDSYKRLLAFRKGEAKVQHVMADGRVIEKNADLAFTRYLIDPKELWARSYAQFVAQESGDRLLLEGLDSMRQGTGTFSNAYPYQWSDEDFQPVVDAIRAIFKEQGLAE